MIGRMCSSSTLGSQTFACVLWAFWSLGPDCALYTVNSPSDLLLLPPGSGIGRSQPVTSLATAAVDRYAGSVTMYVCVMINASALCRARSASSFR